MAMNGAQSLVKTLADCGISLCLGNPGTSEMHFVAALDSEPRMRGVLGLFEGVVTGAADGYARMTGKPAATLLHLGPGFANGMACLHNARRARSAIVNIVGDHATSHAHYADAPLASDILGICRPVSHWLHRSQSVAAVGSDGARAVEKSLLAQGQVSTLLLPADIAWNEGGVVAPPIVLPKSAAVPDAAVNQAATALRNGRKTALLLRGTATHAGVQAAGRIAHATGARLLHDFFTPRVRRGAGLPRVERMPYFAEQIVEFLAGLEQIILVGAPAPVTFFAYPDMPSWVTPSGCDLITLARPEGDSAAALEALADALGATKPAPGVKRLRPELPSGMLDSRKLGEIVARLLPDNAILADEAATCSAGVDRSIPFAAPHDVLYLTGGAIGGQMPVATGAALACPDRKVVTLTGDGGAMYTLQSLWTQAREKLDVTTVILANRSYAVLNIELARVGAVAGGAKATAMLDLHNPELDWVKLSEGMGVAASRATSCEEFADQFASCMRGRGPRLIEAVL